jgi:SAM-dependent methyltransferase
MTDDETYFEYLQQRSRLGEQYRQRWLYPRLSRRLCGRTLDVGCGIGDMLVHRPNTIGVDVNPHTVALCRSRGVEAVQMDPDRLPFAASEFDSVLMDNVLEHIAQPRPLLHEVRRVLRAGGRFLVGVPGRRGWDSDADHKVFYDQSSLAACVESAGFTRMEFFHAPLWRSAWLDRHLRQYCLYGLFMRA